MRVRRRQRPGWAYVLAAALLTGLCLILSGLWLPGVVAAGATATAAVISGFWAARGAAVSQRRADQRQASGLLVRHDERGELPLIRDLADPLSLGVHPAVPLSAGSRNRTPVFITRDSTRELQEVILRDRFVLLVGESTAGKTRAAYEAVRLLLPDRRLVEPLGRQGLPAALETAMDRQGCVLWLDDLERFLGPGGLTGASVRNLLAAAGGSRYIVATMRAEEHARVSGGIGRTRGELSGDSLRHAREVLNLATGIILSRSWSRQELTGAEQHRDDPRVAGALQHASQFGLAEYLASGPQLLADWRDGWAPGAHPRGAALVQGAVDARRAGIHRPLPVSVLTQLHEPYLRGRGGDLLRPEPMDEALGWATTPPYATSSLLIPAGNEMFLAFDYLIDGIGREPIPAEALDAMVAYASADEAVKIGQEASYWDRLDQAEAAYRLAEASGQPDATVLRYYVIHERDGGPLALAFARQVLAERQRILGPDHADTLEAHGLLISEEGDAQRELMTMSLAPPRSRRG
jgi:hypothetical protein